MPVGRETVPRTPEGFAELVFKGHGEPNLPFSGRVQRTTPARGRPPAAWPFPFSVAADHSQAADSPQFIPVPKKVRVRGPVGRPRIRPDAVAGDKAYSSRGNRAHLRKRRIKAVIPEKKDQAANRKKKGSRGGRPVSHDADLYKERNTVERLINKLKAWRGIATRYDKTPDSHLAGLHLRASMIWIKDLTRTTR
ncbi:transposase [Streptomyces sp. NBC_01546]|uniref:transposase n=1 Tax=Streptomyces sp. NBC_01546 TaxID=2975872 RepID=UPI003870DE77